jgi:hypothetical protein
MNRQLPVWPSAPPLGSKRPDRLGARPWLGWRGTCALTGARLAVAPRRFLAGRADRQEASLGLQEALVLLISLLPNEQTALPSGVSNFQRADS